MATTTGPALGDEIKFRMDYTDDYRCGVVWSLGPARGTLWVIPDDHREGEAHAILVRQDRRKMISPTGWWVPEVYTHVNRHETQREACVRLDQYVPRGWSLTLRQQYAYVGRHGDKETANQLLRIAGVPPLF